MGVLAARLGPALRGGRSLEILLTLAIAVPALAFWWHREDGQVTFVLYREPKLIAAALLGWLFAAVFCWAQRVAPPATAFVGVVRRPEMIALAALLSYATATGLWVLVRENYLYELNQYVLLFVLLMLLQVWARRDARVASKVRLALVTSIALVAAAGIWLAFFPQPWLSPIEGPVATAGHPSVMGYKNPAALAVLGQLFLVLQLVFDPAIRGPCRVASGLLLAVELGYLASLQSRTSYAALAFGALVLLGLRTARRPTLRQALQAIAAIAAIAAALLVFVAVLATRPESRERLSTAVAYLLDPTEYLESDRGIYLLNTLNMARHRPFGVGLGDWQTHYPVYRKHEGPLWFSLTTQARRAHSDHVQFLGEIGWPGLALWLTFLVIVIGRAALHYLRTGHAPSLYVSAQLATLAAAMATDYLLELPYNKLQFFLVVFLALACRGERRDNTDSPPPPTRDDPECGARPHRLAFTLAAVAVSVVALLQGLYHVSLARKVSLAAAMRKVYVEVIESPVQAFETGRDDELLVDARALLEVLADGRELSRLAGHTKTLYKDYLVLGHSAHLLGESAVAVAATTKALELHPYSPNAFHLMSRVVDDPEASLLWRRAYDELMRATAGYERPRPPTGH